MDIVVSNQPIAWHRIDRGGVMGQRLNICEILLCSLSRGIRMYWNKSSLSFLFLYLSFPSHTNVNPLPHPFSFLPQHIRFRTHGTYKEKSSRATCADRWVLLQYFSGVSSYGHSLLLLECCGSAQWDDVETVRCWRPARNESTDGLARSENVSEFQSTYGAW